MSNFQLFGFGVVLLRCLDLRSLFEVCASTTQLCGAWQVFGLLCVGRHLVQVQVKELFACFTCVSFPLLHTDMPIRAGKPPRSPHDWLFATSAPRAQEILTATMASAANATDAISRKVRLSRRGQRSVSCQPNRQRNRPGWRHWRKSWNSFDRRRRSLTNLHSKKEMRRQRRHTNLRLKPLDSYRLQTVPERSPRNPIA